MVTAKQLPLSLAQAAAFLTCSALSPASLLPQFERFCRPYYTAGFNAYELVEAAMVSRRAETVGAYHCCAAPNSAWTSCCSTRVSFGVHCLCW